jgi:hypothetical protein
MPIELIVRRHRNTTRDLPWWLTLGEVQLLIVVCFVYSAGIMSGSWAWYALILAGACVLVVKRLMKTHGFLCAGPCDVDERSIDIAKSGSDLVCYGAPIELDKLRRISIEFFEPAIISYYRFPISRITWTTLVVGLLALATATRVLAFGHATAILFVGCVLVLLAFLRCLFRGYYRIVPRRLEVLRYNAFRSTLCSCRVYPLFGARIVCRYDRRWVSVDFDVGRNSEEPRVGDQASNKSPSMTIDLATVANPHAFVEALFAAAMSPHMSPALPKNTLLG